MAPFSSNTGKGCPSCLGWEQTPQHSSPGLLDPALPAFPASTFTKQHDQSVHEESHCPWMSTWQGTGSVREQGLLSRPSFKHDKPQPRDSKNFDCAGTLKVLHLNSNFRVHLLSGNFQQAWNMPLMDQHLVSGCFSNWNRQWMGSNITPEYHVEHGPISNFWTGIWDYVWISDTSCITSKSLQDGPLWRPVIKQPSTVKLSKFILALPNLWVIL